MSSGRFDKKRLQIRREGVLAVMTHILAGILAAACLFMTGPKADVYPVASNGQTETDVYSTDLTPRAFVQCDLADLAAIQLHAYGILPGSYDLQSDLTRPVSRQEAVGLLYAIFGQGEQCPASDFEDVDPDYAAAVSWAYTHGYSSGVSERCFNGHDLTRDEFGVILLRTLTGSSGAMLEAMSDLQELGVAPVGVSDGMTWGDVLLYCDAAMKWKASQVDMSVSEFLGRTPERTGFPQWIALYPSSWDDAEAQLQYAMQFLPRCVSIYSDNWTDADMVAYYQYYRSMEFEAWGNVYDQELWISQYVQPVNGFMVSASDRNGFTQAERDELWALKSGLDTDEIDGMTYFYLSDMMESEYLDEGAFMMMDLSYMESWELICDLNEVFALYENDNLSYAADAFYQEKIVSKGLESDYDIIMAAKSAVCSAVSYDTPVSGYGRDATYRPEAHSIKGFFDGQRVVCDGYASMFQYLMLRAGIDCVGVLGSTYSRSDAQENIYDHAWNKVKLDGAWYNMDVCWADTGYYSSFDLKSDSNYMYQRHWAVYGGGGVYGSEQSYMR